MLVTHDILSKRISCCISHCPLIFLYLFAKETRVFVSFLLLGKQVIVLGLGIRKIQICPQSQMSKRFSACLAQMDPPPIEIRLGQHGSS
ncbi:hypothetical protein VNO78_23813 [Psophocarpus tetragonolobus]|uniref:Uncharacterized protein n=1 Tax=Psophocarpus tetragonolobus TaxID=3891 RepID=A0AAN9S4A9_PSOTE